MAVMQWKIIYFTYETFFKCIKINHVIIFYELFIRYSCLWSEIYIQYLKCFFFILIKWKSYYILHILVITEQINIALIRFGMRFWLNINNVAFSTPAPLLEFCNQWTSIFWKGDYFVCVSQVFGSHYYIFSSVKWICWSSNLYHIPKHFEALHISCLIDPYYQKLIRPLNWLEGFV